MTDEEAIKYLQQLYPNGGYSWLDEQRIKAINMAIDALKGEPISEDLEKVARKYAGIPEDSPHDLKYCVQDKKAKYDAVLYGANWQKEQIMAKGVDGVARPDDGEVRCDLKSFDFKDGDKVKVIVINED